MAGYTVVYADPPWSFATWSARGRDRSPDSHYSTVPFEQLKTLPVGDWAAEDAVLLLWVPDPFLPLACELAQAWGGFTFRTVGFYWVKTGRGVEAGPSCLAATRNNRLFPVGLGYYGRANPEQCWLFMRGRVERRARDVEKLVIAPRLEHSRKPEVVHGRIERLFPGPYLELFARRQMPGWQVWGDEVDMGEEELAALESPVEAEARPVLTAVGG